MGDCCSPSCVHWLEEKDHKMRGSELIPGDELGHMVLRSHLNWVFRNVKAWYIFSLKPELKEKQRRYFISLSSGRDLAAFTLDIYIYKDSGDRVPLSLVCANIYNYFRSLLCTVADQVSIALVSLKSDGLFFLCSDIKN